VKIRKPLIRNILVSGSYIVLLCQGPNLNFSDPKSEKFRLGTWETTVGKDTVEVRETLGFAIQHPGAFYLKTYLKLSDSFYGNRLKE
jgi:hypothetical protein